MRKLIKIVLSIVVVFILGLSYLLIFHSYHGNQYTVVSAQSTNTELPINSEGTTLLDKISDEGQNLVGTLYDPLKGSVYNIGGRMGFIVCIDVPRIAYGHAGISLTDLLAQDYEKHPEHYDTENGINTPETPFFFRRVRNVYDFAKGNDLLIEKAESPKVGDIVFYGKYHATMVTEVHEDGTYNEVEAHPALILVKEHQNKEWTPRDVARIIK